MRRSNSAWASCAVSGEVKVGFMMRGGINKNQGSVRGVREMSQQPLPCILQAFGERWLGRADEDEWKGVPVA